MTWQRSTEVTEGQYVRLTPVGALVVGGDLAEVNRGQYVRLAPVSALVVGGRLGEFTRGHQRSRQRSHNMWESQNNDQGVNLRGDTDVTILIMNGQKSRPD